MLKKERLLPLNVSFTVIHNLYTDYESRVTVKLIVTTLCLADVIAIPSIVCNACIPYLEV